MRKFLFAGLLGGIITYFLDLKKGGQRRSSAAGRFGGATKRVRNQAQSIGDQAIGAVQSVGTQASETAHAVGTQASETVQAVGTQASQTAHAVGTQASQTAHAVGTQASQTAHAVGTQASQTAHAVGAQASQTAQSIAGAAQSVVQERVATKRDNPNPDDLTLRDRVESQIFRDEETSRENININVVGGIVEVRGELPQGEIDTVIRRIKDIPDVKGVSSYLHTPGTSAPNKESAIEAS